ncbi:MAG: TonB-dependent receptor plug domain-containing protein [Cyclobacteriaceae bacterium]
MKKYHKLLLTATLLLGGLSAFVWKADPVRDILNRIEQELATYRVNLNPEKMYVQLDKSQYVAGETLWFKAYLLHASSLEPLNLDEVVYVDLINREGQAVQQISMKADEGMLSGQLSLPDSLQTADYQLVAYTQWMRNFDDKQFFRKNIRIWQPETTAAEATEVATSEIQVADLQFFPEGGDWIAGISSKLAFKAINQQGLGVEVDGRIVNSTGETVAPFESLHAGMGEIQLKPEAGESYTALLKQADGSESRFPLPEVKEAGFALAVDEYSEASSLQVEIQAADVDNETLLLTVIGNDQVVHSQSVEMPEKSQIISIDKSELPVGINRINLASEEGMLLAERLVFMHPEKQLNIELSLDEPEYLKREEVTMQVKTTDAEGNPVPANLSLAVTDASLVPEDHEHRNITSHLLLTSDLKGYVENPDYYFANIDADKKAALRLLMMTHGWRRFGWNEVLRGEKPQFTHARENALSIDGRLVSEKGEPVSKGEVVLYVKDRHETFMVTDTDENGYFSFEGFDFSDTVEVVVQGTTAKGKRNVKVLMDEGSFVPAWKDGYPLPADELMASNGRFIALSANQAAVEESYRPGLREMLLKEIIVEERASQIVEPMRLLTQPDVVIDADDLPFAPSGNILQSLQGRVAGLQVYPDGFNDFRAVIRGSGTPLYLIDGMPVDPSAMNMISQFDVDRIEVIKGPTAAVYGGRGGGGVIALFTKRGGVEYDEVEPSDNIIIHRAAGFQQYREFYAPKYSAEGQTERPDYRTTIHWEPKLQTDEKGEASLSFFTADRAAAYRVLINGITDGGLPGSVQSSFNVVDPEEVSP